MPAHHRLLPVTAALAVAAALLGACGDDDSSDGADTTTAATLTEAEFVEQANALCASANQAILQVVGPLFGGGEPSPEDQQAALDQVVAVSRQLGVDIGALAEPSTLTEDVDAMVTAFAEADDAAAAQTGEEFFGSDDDPWAGAQSLATDLGLDACGADG